LISDSSATGIPFATGMSFFTVTIPIATFAMPGKPAVPMIAMIVDVILEFHRLYYGFPVMQVLAGFGFEMLTCARIVCTNGITVLENLWFCGVFYIRSPYRCHESR
jgi:hypothetical protein